MRSSHWVVASLCAVSIIVASASDNKQCPAGSEGPECAPLCVDIGPNCAENAAAGHCESNAQHMWTQCAASCGSCQLLTGGWEEQAKTQAEHCRSAQQTVDQLQAAIDALPVKNAANIARVISSSQGFRRDMWARCPFVLQMGGNLMPGFDLEAMLLLADGKLRSTGSNTFMEAGVKAGKFQAFRMDYSGKGELIDRANVLRRMQDSSWLLSAIHTLHKQAGDLTLTFQNAFGLPASANMYATLPDFDTAAPQHTDRMDAFLLQTSGKKHWKVWLPKVTSPVWGVHENGQWGKGFSKMGSVGPLLLDHTLEPGDLLYVPRGFVHQTSTTTPTDRTSDTTDASVALTVALSTEMYDLVYEKALHCVLWKAAVCTEHPCAEATRVSARARSDEALRKSLPLGFMKEELGPQATSKEFWIEALTMVLGEMFTTTDLTLSDTQLEAVQEASREFSTVLWDTLEQVVKSEGLKSYFAPTNYDVGACIDPKCNKRGPVPPDKRQDAIGRVLGFEMRHIANVCPKGKVFKPYIDMQRPSGGLIDRI